MKRKSSWDVLVSRKVCDANVRLLMGKLSNVQSFCWRDVSNMPAKLTNCYGQCHVLLMLISPYTCTHVTRVWHGVTNFGPCWKKPLGLWLDLVQVRNLLGCVVPSYIRMITLLWMTKVPKTCLELIKELMMNLEHKGTMTSCMNFHGLFFLY